MIGLFLLHTVKFVELIELLETVLVDQLLQATVRIVAKLTVIVEDHHLTVFLRIGLPGR